MGKSDMEMGEVTDLDRCRRALRGDEQAADAIIVDHYERVYRWLRRLVRQDEEASDLTQQTFMRVWTALPTYRGQSTLSTWIHGIAYHVYVDWRRRKHETVALSGNWWEQAVEEKDWPSELAGHRDEARRLFRLVESLEEDLRLTLHLHYYERFSIAETAHVMGVATSTIKYRLRQALQRLRHELHAIVPSASGDISQ